MIKVNNLTIKLNNINIIDNLSFELQKNSILTIIGKNGIGKTTFLNCLIKKYDFFTGDIIIDNQNIKDYNIKEISKIIGIVYSNNEVFQNILVSDFLVMGNTNEMNFFDKPNKEKYDNAYKVLKSLGKEYLYEKEIYSLSSGEMQIVKIARIIIQNPKVMLFDEPMANLDIEMQLIILDILLQLSKDGHIIILTTHNAGHMIDLGNYGLILQKNNYIFGKTENLLTEQYLKQTYNVNARIDTLNRKTVIEFFDNKHSLIM